MEREKENESELKKLFAAEPNYGEAFSFGVHGDHNDHKKQSERDNTKEHIIKSMTSMLIIKLKTSESNNYFDSMVHKLFIDLKLDWKYQDHDLPCGPHPPIPPAPVGGGGVFGAPGGFGGGFG